MSKPYEVLELSFINGRLYRAGETVELEIDSPGTNLKEVEQEDGRRKPGKPKAELPDA